LEIFRNHVAAGGQLRAIRVICSASTHPVAETAILKGASPRFDPSIDRHTGNELLQERGLQEQA